VGRYHPQKDHANFLAAMAELVHMHAMKIRCVLVGTDCDVHNADLMALITKLHLNEVVLCCGPRADIPAVMSALDLHVLSSRGESFPNVVAEAMACGTPCVVTDVGDAAFIVGDTGWVVESQHSTALAIAIRSALLEKTNEKAQWENRKSACVKRVRQHFSLEKMTASYVDVWRSVVNGGHTR
jgi:glycosyltransferase involved in cell wall biosynthesis